MLGDNHYIHRLRVSCLKQPQFNRHQLLALDHELALATNARDIDHYLSQSADLLELARAGLLDRAANSLASAKRYDDPWIAAAAGIEYQAALEGACHAELYTCLLAGQQAAAPLRALSAQVLNCFERMFLSLLHVHTSHLDQPEAHLDIRLNLEQLCAADPHFVAALWIQKPRYRLRLPWPEAPLHDWLRPLWPAVPASARLNLEDPSVRIEALLARWKAGLQNMSVEWPAAVPLEMPASHGMEETFLERQKIWPDPLLARHWLESRDAITSATTPIGLEAICEERQSRFRIEAIWNTLWLSGLLAPMLAAIGNAKLKDRESAAALIKASATTRALSGLGPKALLSLPRLQYFIRHNLLPNLSGSPDSLGALSGEAGFDLLRELRNGHDAADQLDFAALVPQADPPAHPQPVYYWNRILTQGEAAQ